MDGPKYSLSWLTLFGELPTMKTRLFYSLIALAFCFDMTFPQFTETKLTPGDGAADDLFGWSVSLSGDYALIGAHGDGDNGTLAGSAYIFHFDGSNWSEETKLTASDGAVYDFFGWSVSLSDDYALIGADGDDDNGEVSGSAYIFYFDGSNWSEQVKLTASDGTVGDLFGSSVSLSGDYALIGAHDDGDNGDASGSAYVYARSVSVPDQVILVSPGDGAIVTVDSVGFLWHQSAPVADYYWLELSNDSLFTNPQVDSTLVDTATVVTALQTNQTYYWKVSAHNDAGWGEFSEVWNFTVLLTGVENQEEVPGEFSLSQNYPNPFNPSTTIRYGLPEKAHVRFEVFNLLGQQVALLVDGDEEAGWHEAGFGSQGLASGVYVYRIRAGDFVATKKLILLR